MKKIIILLIILLCTYPLTVLGISIDGAFTVTGGSLEYEGIGTNTLLQDGDVILSYEPHFYIRNQGYNPDFMGSTLEEAIANGYIIGEYVDLGYLYSGTPPDPGVLFTLTINLDQWTPYIVISGRTYEEGGWPGGPLGGDFIGFSDGNPANYYVGFTGSGMAGSILALNPIPTVVPEPSTWLLLGTGLAGLAYYRRKKN